MVEEYPNFVISPDQIVADEGTTRQFDLMIHIVFSASAADTLRQALRAREQKAQVLDLTAMLEWGPITDGDFTSRVEWFDAHWPDARGGWNWLSEEPQKFCDDASDADEHLVWLAPRSAGEQAGFYWYLHMFGSSEMRMVIADHGLRIGGPRHEAPLGLGELNVAGMMELLEEAPRSNWDPARFPKEKWENLVAKGSNLRIVEANDLISAEENFFDHDILDRCPAEWTKFYYVLGHAMADLAEDGHVLGDDFLFWRMGELYQSGKIECNGTFPCWGAGPHDVPLVRRKL